MRYDRIWYAMNVYQVPPPQTVPSQFIIEILQLQNPKRVVECNTHNYLKVYLKYTHIFEWIVCIYVCACVCFGLRSFQCSIETSNFQSKAFPEPLTDITQIASKCIEFETRL